MKIIKVKDARVKFYKKDQMKCFYYKDKRQTMKVKTCKIFFQISNADVKTKLQVKRAVENLPKTKTFR